jgi:hypothetical protein
VTLVVVTADKAEEAEQAYPFRSSSAFSASSAPLPLSQSGVYRSHR